MASMGVYYSSCLRFANQKVEDFAGNIESDRDDDDYVERITHITADIHEILRRKDNIRVEVEELFCN